ncbi:transposase, partial [Phormidesmis priestleyi]|uniref:transposase n=1 Tax=Phormidesmis priestleyi TaxID=268141 RepID=UPI001FD4662D
KSLMWSIAARHGKSGLLAISYPELRLNNIIEQDHRIIKRLTKPMMGFGSFNTARRTLSGIEAMSMIRKGQVKGVSKAIILNVKNQM